MTRTSYYNHRSLLRMATATTPLSRVESEAMTLERGQQQQQQQADQQGWSSGLLGEGELFYVDLSSDNVDGFGSPYGYEYLSGMCQHVAARLTIAEGEMSTTASDSCGDTETISKTDSHCMDSLDRVRRGTSGGECPGMPRLPSLPSPLIESNAPAASSRVVKVRKEGAADPCVAMFRGVQRAWGCITGSQSHQGCEDRGVEYTCQHLASCTSFKHFGKFKSDVDVLSRLGVAPGTYAIQITRFRVVSTMWQRHEEYEVCLVGGGRRWVSWEDFSKFELVADFSSKIDRSCSKAWVRVLMVRFHYRSLDREHLAMKCSVLEMIVMSPSESKLVLPLLLTPLAVTGGSPPFVRWPQFLKQVLFAIPTPAFLVQFISPTSNI